MKSATGLTGSGVRDWIVQRVSAIVLAIYTVVMLVWFATHSGFDYNIWYDFMTSFQMRILNLLAMLSLAGHAWVGMWTIFTDYVKSNVVRLILQSLMILAVLVYAVWGVAIFWGN